MAAICLALGTLAPALNGQDQQDAEGEVFDLEEFEVNVSGFAGSIAAATERKRLSPVIIDSIVAEDLGKLPDTSIADSLARLPGLTTQRINSRAQDIVIRGLNGDFSTGLLNGRQQVSTGSDRAVQFDIYPAELLNGVTVYKTSTANLVGQGLAGTIDMQTVRPLSVGTRRIAVNAFYDWTEYTDVNPDEKSDGFRYSMNYIDQFNEGTVGIAIGYAHTEQPGQGYQSFSWGYPALSDGNMVMGGYGLKGRSSTLDRDSLLGVLEWRPNNNVHTTFDVFYSDFTEDQKIRGLEFPFLWGAAGPPEPGYTAVDGLVTEGTFTGVYTPVMNDMVWREANILNLGWNLQIGDGSGWVYDVDLSHSKIERDDNILSTYAGYGVHNTGPSDTVSFSLQGEAGIEFDTTLDYSDPTEMQIADVAAWGTYFVPPAGQHGYYKGPLSEDEINQYKFKAEHDLDWGVFSKVQLGVAYTDRTKWEQDNGEDGRSGYFMQLADGSLSGPLPPVIGAADTGVSGIKVVAYDVRKAVDDGLFKFIQNEWDATFVDRAWEVSEEELSAFLQFHIDTKIGNVPVTGSLGVRYLDSSQSSVGLSSTSSGFGQLEVTPVSGSHDYEDWAPSLNLIFQLTDSTILRFSAARQVARQEMVDMRINSSYNFDIVRADSTDVNASPWSGSAGNIELEPWRSNSLDLSLEKYFADNKGYVSVAGFYKDLVSYTYIESVIADFSGFWSPVEPAIYEGYSNKPQNGEGGELKGVEFTVSLTGELLTDALTGFGMIFSGSLLDSSIQQNPADPSEPIPGLSDQIFSTTVYYEHPSGFSARISNRYRSDYRGDIATFGIPGERFRTLQSESVWDAQISYSFQEGSRLEGLTLILQGYNLTDEPLKATFGSSDPRMIQDYQRYGAQYSVGASYKF